MHGERVAVRLGAWRLRSWVSSFSWSVLVGCGGDARQERAKPPPKITFEDIGSGEMVDVGGRDCTWSASVPAGQRFSSRRALAAAPAWADVLPELGRKTRTCAYDRAGIGASDAIPGVHDAGEEIRDLERLLDRGRIEPPYVLVGHSYGGLLARLFAHAHPDQTGGVVLIDATAAMTGDADSPYGRRRSRPSGAEPGRSRSPTVSTAEPARRSPATSGHWVTRPWSSSPPPTTANSTRFQGLPPEIDRRWTPTEAGDADRVGGTLDRSRPRPRDAQRPLHLPRPAGSSSFVRSAPSCARSATRHRSRRASRCSPVQGVRCLS